MYHGSMRIGEVSKSRTTKHTLTYNDILFTAEGDLAINFKTFKHSNGSESIILKQNVNSNICPVLTLQNYLQHRPPSSGDPSQNFLFQYPDGEVISRSFVTNILKKTINTLGLNSKDFNCHSFRIGHTTDLFNANFPDYYIRRSGRWKSDAWKVYVKSALVVWWFPPCSLRHHGGPSGYAVRVGRFMRWLFSCHILIFHGSGKQGKMSLSTRRFWIPMPLTESAKYTTFPDNYELDNLNLNT